MKSKQRGYGPRLGLLSAAAVVLLAAAMSATAGPPAASKTTAAAESRPKRGPYPLCFDFM